MEKGEAIISVAKKQIGIKEVPFNSNDTIYNQWFGLRNLPWCGMFVSWVYHHAGYPLPKIGFTKGFAGCQIAVEYFTKNHKVVKFPIAGDLVFFDFNRDGRFDHVGIYAKNYDANTIKTIEGNTAIGNDRNGGMVMVRKRNSTNVIFVRP